MKKNMWEIIAKTNLEVGEDGFLTEECIKKLNLQMYGTENPTVEQIFEEVEDDEED